MNFLFISNWTNRADKFGLTYRSMFILVSLSVASTVTEIFGIGVFLPIFQFIRLEGNIDALITDSSLWQYIVNIFDYFNIKPSLAYLLVISFILFLVRQFFTYLKLVYTTVVLHRLIQVQRNRLFNKYIEADTLYHDSVPVGNLVNVISTEVNRAMTGIMSPLELLVYSLMLMFYLIVLSVLSWQMTLFAIVAFIIISYIPKVWIIQSKDTGRKLVNANSLMSEFLIGRLRSPRLVRLSGTEIAEKNEFHRLTLKQRKHIVFSSILQSKTEVSMEPALIAVSLIFLYLSYSVLHLQIEVIGLYLVIVLRLMPIIKSIVKKIQSIQNLLGSIEILENRFDIMEQAREKDNGSIILRNINNKIFLNNISYHYLAENDDVLKNVSIEFKAHTMTAIVGPSGGGKSTLIDLIPRLRLPTDGFIEIDGQAIGNFSLNSLRELISYTPQSPQIFNGTVRNHILYGKRDATEDEIEEAAILSGANDFINKLPQGYDTILGDDAIRLSGGQRQRLDLARALVRKSDVIILDEPTSNLDAESEMMFRRVLTHIREKRNTTIIIVAHRLKSVMDADQIVVLNKGKVESIGIHHELLQEKKWYYEAWNMQEDSIDDDKEEQI